MPRLALAICLMSIPLAAQWPQRPTPGLPRTPEGKPNLAANPARTADGRPDLTGVWMVSNGSFYLNPDLKPEDMQPWAATLYKQREDSYRRDTDGIRCLPPGPKAGIGLGNFPMKVVQTPGLIVILYEYQRCSARFSRTVASFLKIRIQHGWGTRLGIGRATRWW